MDYEEMLTDQGIQSLGQIEEAVGLGLARPQSDMQEDDKLETCSYHPKDPNKTYYVVLDGPRCGEVDGSVAFFCQHHYTYLAEKRSQFPIEEANHNE